MQQWELCEVWKNGQVEYKGRMYYSVGINYFAPTGVEFYTLAEMEGKNAKPFAYGPYGRAISLLLAAGWEPVSKNGGYYGGVPVGGGGTRLWSTDAAVFKRPVEPGRAVDEPKLVDLIQPSS